jgi:hypothetical protein
MASIYNVQQLVHRALLDTPETRADDFILVLEVWRNFVAPEMQIKTVLRHHAELGIPSFETIRRTRQKLQSQYPELKDKATAERRAEAEKDYRAYAINN